MLGRNENVLCRVPPALFVTVFTKTGVEPVAGQRVVVDAVVVLVRVDVREREEAVRSESGLKYAGKSA